MKNILFAVLLLSDAAIGQKKTDTLIYPNEKVIVETDSMTTSTSEDRFIYNTFWSNWFVTAGAGGQVFFGNEEGLKSFGQRITPTLEVSFGKWIHPAIALRAKFGGGPVKSYSTGIYPTQGHSLVTSGPDANGIYTMTWHHLYGEGDLMVDLCNAIGGYKPHRFYSVIPYLGVGISIVQNQPRHDGDRSAMGVGGVYNQFRLSRHFDFNAEFKDVIVKQTVDRLVSGRDFESWIALTAGFTYHFGEGRDRFFVRGGNSKTRITNTYTHQPNIPIIEKHRDTVIKEQTIKEVTIEKPMVLSHPMAVFFELNKATISARDKVNLAFVADVIKSSKGAKFKLIGSADSKTASPRYNQKLSARRCVAVRDYLVKVLMVEPDQLTLEPIGGIDRYGAPTADRTVIIKQEE